ncbi:MAG: hypothetical protein K9N23_19810 [Akkermansiaceae bacterium]|nr:hypothetical protein [Akkermansiaceae bacterium]
MRAISTILSVLAAISCAARSAEEKPASLAAIGALSLPREADGMVHLRVGAGASVPLQLSLRYFTAPLKVSGGVLQLFKEPVPAQPPLSPPSPLLTVHLPETTKLAYVVISVAPDAQGIAVWRARVLDAENWPEDSLKLFNATDAALGVEIAGKRLMLLAGKTVNYRAADHPESFPVGIYQFEPRSNKIFSSIWRVSASQRELCVLFSQNGGISLRSLMATDAPHSP